MNIHDQQEGDNFEKEIDPKESRFVITPMLSKKENLRASLLQQNNAPDKKRNEGKEYVNIPLQKGDSKFTVSSPIKLSQNLRSVQQIDEVSEPS